MLLLVWLIVIAFGLVVFMTVLLPLLLLIAGLLVLIVKRGKEKKQ